MTSHLSPRITRELAQAASAFHAQRTGHTPAAVTVVLAGDTLVFTLHGALSPAEQAMAATPQGAARVQDFHRALFATSVDGLRGEIERIANVRIREAAAEIEAKSGTVVHAFTSGTMVQIYLLLETSNHEVDGVREVPSSA